MAGLKPRNTVMFVVGWLVLVIVAVLLMLATGDTFASILPMRVVALIAYLTAFVTILGVLFNKELIKYFGRKFIDVHHVVSVGALALMVLHPLMTLVAGYPLSILLPDFTTLFNAFARTGPIALLLFAAASLFALLRASLKSSWRELHWLVYLGFIVASVHGSLLGANLQGTVARIVVALFALGIVVIYVVKRMPRKAIKRSL